MIGYIFHLIFYQPLYNMLVFLVGIIPYHDVGIAVIILTLITRIIVFPLSHRAIITQRKMRTIEPEMKQVKEKFKKDKQEQTRQTMALYKAHGISPFSGFLMLLIQLPILIALYKLFSSGIQFSGEELYFFVSLPAEIRTVFLGLIDIFKSNYILAALAGITQFFQMYFAMPKVAKIDANSNSFSDQLSRSMAIQGRYIMPIFVFFIALKFSSGIALYWTAMNVFAIVHEAVVAYKAKRNQNNNGNAVRKC